jgi:hypothetical protein
MAAQKRDSQRIELLGAITAEVMVLQPASVHQISRGGMQVETAFPMQLDALREFRLALGGHKIVIKGRVAHSRIVDVIGDLVIYRSGIEFIEPSDAVSSVIDGFVTALQDRSEDPAAT